MRRIVVIVAALAAAGAAGCGSGQRYYQGDPIGVLSPEMRLRRLRVEDVAADVQRDAARLARARARTAPGLARAGELADRGWRQGWPEIGGRTGRAEIDRLVAAVEGVENAAAMLMHEADQWERRLHSDRLMTSGGRNLYEADRLVDERRAGAERYASRIDRMIRVLEELAVEVPRHAAVIERAWDAHAELEAAGGGGQVPGGGAQLGGGHLPGGSIEGGVPGPGGPRR